MSQSKNIVFNKLKVLGEITNNTENIRKIQESFNIPTELFSSIKLINDIQHKYSTVFSNTILQTMQPTLISINQMSKQLSEIQIVINNQPLITSIAQIQKSMGAYQSVFYDNISKQISEMANIQDQLSKMII